jgi:hypothetical protein
MFTRLLGTLFSPTRTLRLVAEERPVLPAAVVALLGAWGWAFGVQRAHLAPFLTPADLAAPFFPIGEPVFFLAHRGHPVAVWFAFIPLATLGWFLRTALLHLLSELMGGSGKAFSLLATVGFADLPLVLLLPAAWLCARWAGDPPSVGMATLWYVLAAAIHLWAATLTVIGVRETHRLHTGKAAAIFIFILVAFLSVSVLLAFTKP